MPAANGSITTKPCASFASREPLPASMTMCPWSDVMRFMNSLRVRAFCRLRKPLTRRLRSSSVMSPSLTASPPLTGNVFNTLAALRRMSSMTFRPMTSR